MTDIVDQLKDHAKESCPSAWQTHVAAIGAYAIESARDECQKFDYLLRCKDDAMQVLFDRCKSAGVDASDLIP